MLFLPALPAHVPALSQLARTSFTQTFAHLYPPQDLAAFLNAAYAHEALLAEVENPRHYWLLVWEDDAPIAYVQCAPVGLPHPEADPALQGEIKRLYVLQSHQGHGLGKTLMAKALEALTARYGAADQWVGVWSQNHKAQALYQACGFSKAGAYIFPVGAIKDDEWILRRRP